MNAFAMMISRAFIVAAMLYGAFLVMTAADNITGFGNQLKFFALFFFPPIFVIWFVFSPIIRWFGSFGR